MPSYTITNGDQLTINGDLQVYGLSTEIFTVAELALMDIIPKIKETHPDLYLKYISIMPESLKDN